MLGARNKTSKFKKYTYTVNNWTILLNVLNSKGRYSGITIPSETPSQKIHGMRYSLQEEGTGGGKDQAGGARGEQALPRVGESEGTGSPCPLHRKGKIRFPQSCKGVGGCALVLWVLGEWEKLQTLLPYQWCYRSYRIWVECTKKTETVTIVFETK